MARIAKTGAAAAGSLRLACHPLTPARWPDFAALFGPRGACGGCWCMWWRSTAEQFRARKGEKNRRAMKRLVDAGRAPGLLVYHEKRAVGWCAVAPREQYPRLERSRVLRRVDDQPVWSVVCLFVDRAYRGRGVATRLLREAVAHVRRSGGRIVEGYAVEPRAERVPDVFAFPGLARSYRAAGFHEAARRSATRPIMRRVIRARGGGAR